MTWTMLLAPSLFPSSLLRSSWFLLGVPLLFITTRAARPEAEIVRLQAPELEVPAANAAVQLCPLSASLPAVAAYSGACAVLAISFHFFGPVDAVSRTTWISLLLFMFGPVHAMLALGSSHALCAFLGLDEAVSGAMVGAVFFGVGLACIVVWWILNRWPDAWNQHMKVILCSGTAISLAGSILYAAEASGLLTAFDKFSTIIILNTARALQGVSVAVVGLVFMKCYVSMYAEKDQHWIWPKQMLAINLGLGLGPLLSGLAESQTSCPGNLRPLQQHSLMILATLILCMALCCMLPDLPSDLPGTRERNKRWATASSSRTEQQDVYVLLGTIFMELLRALTAGAMEAGIAYVLEVEHGWDQNKIGLAIAAGFMSGLPLNAVVDSQFGMRISPMSWIRISSFFNAISSMLFASLVCDHLKSFIGSCSSLILAAGMLSLPFLYLASGECWALIALHALPEGTWLDQNNLNLLGYICMDMIGRFMGPVWARYVLAEASGQDRYAMQQLVVVAIWACIFEVVVVPNTREPNTHNEQKRLSSPRPSF